MRCCALAPAFHTQDSEGLMANHLPSIALDAQSREIEAVERLLLSQGPADILRPHFEHALGWPGRWAWYGVRIPTESFIPDPGERKGLPGDLDLIGGPLEADPHDLALAHANAHAKLPSDADPSWHSFLASTELFHSRKLRWPPSLQRITAAEVKSASLDHQGKSHAHRGAARKALRQAQGLVEVGFDSVALVWIAVAYPVPASDFHSWLDASRAASTIRNFLVRRRIQVRDDQDYGQLLVHAGALQHAPEFLAGSIGAEVLRAPPALEVRPHSARSARRAALSELLLAAFREAPFAPSLPVVLRYCRACRRPLLSPAPLDRACTKCGRRCD